MTTLEIYERDYQSYCDIQEDTNKYEWAASNVFHIITYDGGLDELFVKIIIEVCEVILNRTSFEYIKDDDNYMSYILVCNLLSRNTWLEWGTSIRGAWFEVQGGSWPILEYWTEEDGFKMIPFTIDNLKDLIKFMKEE